MNENEEEIKQETGATLSADVYIPVQYGELIELITARTERDLILAAYETSKRTSLLDELVKVIAALHSPLNEIEFEGGDEYEDDY